MHIISTYGKSINKYVIVHSNSCHVYYVAGKISSMFPFELAFDIEGAKVFDSKDEAVEFLKRRVKPYGYMSPAKNLILKIISRRKFKVKGNTVILSGFLDGKKEYYIRPVRIDPRTGIRRRSLSCT